MTTTIAEILSRIAEDPALTEVHGVVLARTASDPGHDLSHALRVAVWTLRLLPSGPSISWLRLW